MPTTRIPIDGLWRCLCPTFDAAALRSSSLRLRPCTPRTKPSSRRALHTTSSLKKSHNTKEPYASASSLALPQIFPTPAPRPFPYIEVPKAPHSLRRGKFLDLVSLTPINEIHDGLKDMCGRKGSYKRVCDLVEYLVTVREDKVGLLHFDALVRANADAEYGSVQVLRGLLGQMRELEIKGDSGFYHGVLLVLAIHPDYLLRLEILEEMKNRWFGLSPDGWHNLVIGLLRDNHLEVAMDKLEQMHVDRIRIQPWLYDIFLFKLCEADELDEALKVLHHRYEVLGEDIPPAFWYFLLDKFSIGLHYEGTKYVWKAQVQGSYITPSDGTCLAVLNLAARHADPEIGTAALRILSSRHTALSSFHYEALLESYLKYGDIQTAFRILSIMSKAGLEPNSSTTRALFLHLASTHQPRAKISRKQNCERAWKMLENMHRDGHLIPPAAVNVILETLVYDDNHEAAIELYKEVHTLCKANTDTFNTLLRKLATSRSKHMAMFLASEMQVLGIKPDQMTYDRLVLVCAQEANYEDAFRYAEEMKEVGKSRAGEVWLLRKGTMTHLFRRCITAGDERAWRLLEQLKETGTDTAELVDWARQSWSTAVVSRTIEWPKITSTSSPMDELVNVSPMSVT